MCSAVFVTFCLLVTVGNAAPGTVREKRCQISRPSPDTSNSIRKVTLPDFTQELSDVPQTSQHFSQNYSGPLILEWTITHYSATGLTLDNVTLSDSADCQDEYLEVRSVKSSESRMVLRTCGVRAFYVTGFLDSAINFRLYLQDAQRDHGVSFTYSMDGSLLYGKTLLTEPSGELTSPDYPGLPTPIPPSSGHVAFVTPFRTVKLTLTDYDFISSSICQERNVTLVVIYNINGVLNMEPICGADGAPIVTSTNFFIVYLETKHPNVIDLGRGYKFTYEELPLEL